MDGQSPYKAPAGCSLTDLQHQPVRDHPSIQPSTSRAPIGASRMLKLLFFFLVLPPSFCSSCIGINRVPENMEYRTETEAWRAAMRDADVDLTSGGRPFLELPSRQGPYIDQFYAVKRNYACTSTGAETTHDIVAIQNHSLFTYPGRNQEPIYQADGQPIIYDHIFGKDKNGRPVGETRPHFHVRVALRSKDPKKDPEIWDTSTPPNCYQHYFFKTFRTGQPPTTTTTQTPPAGGRGVVRGGGGVRRAGEGGRGRSGGRRGGGGKRRRD